MQCASGQRVLGVLKNSVSAHGAVDCLAAYTRGKETGGVALLHMFANVPTLFAQDHKNRGCNPRNASETQERPP